MIVKENHDGAAEHAACQAGERCNKRYGRIGVLPEQDDRQGDSFIYAAQNGKTNDREFFYAIPVTFGSD